ncbi:MAG TPA: hypothetical protein ENH34_06250, partial [Phycisphaerales bacterium]|nr:hypothetical protein [Phycisphaerales bacterium]
REDILDMHSFRNLRQVRELTGDWQIDYNYDRGHESLYGKSPVEYSRSFSLSPSVICEGQKRKTAKFVLNSPITTVQKKGY